MTSDYRDLILSYLHDPPDKALEIRGHESRAARLATLALGEEVHKDDLHSRTREEDILASIAERIPLPSAGPKAERAVGVEGETLQVYHPLSGAERSCSVSALRQVDPIDVLQEIVQGVDSPRARFLLIWRLFRDKLTDLAPEFGVLPADTRIPDHSIWNHLDVAAAWRASLSGAHGSAFLHFSLGPVQGFIAAARSLRDLWTGSYLLSWLTFHAMGPVLDALGPTAFIYPALRGVPLVDWWLNLQPGVSGKVMLPRAETLRAPCLPNRFLALVPWGEEGQDAGDLAGKCKLGCKEALRSLSQEVRGFLDAHLGQRWPDWANLWEEQIESFFEIRTAVLPLRACGDQVLGALLSSRDGKTFHAAMPNAAAVRKLAESIPKEDRPPYGQSATGRWAGQVELAGKSLAAVRSIRHVPTYSAKQPVPQKCSILGTYEQLGPAGLEESNRFWSELADTAIKGAGGVRLRKRERLCAVSMLKRFAWPVYLARELDLDRFHGTFTDTATVAAHYWLKEAGINPDDVRQRHRVWNGQWLHWSRPDQSEEGDELVPADLWATITQKRQDSKNGRPPAYLAVLKMDGDEMGRWLAGEKGPRVREILHPKIQSYFESLSGQPVQAALDARRPVSPALHAAISEALSNYALGFVPEIVERYGGTLIYAGGDDLLAFLPLRSAIACAYDLRTCFSAEWQTGLDGKDRLLMGSRASVSGGLAVVHHKEDLRAALQAARAAEQQAKQTGRNALALAVWRRSGEHAQAVMEWDFAPVVQAWVSLFLLGASDRWTYRLREALAVLNGLGTEVFEAEMRRLVKRSRESKTQQAFAENELQEQFARYHVAMVQRCKQDGPEGGEDPAAKGALVRSDFVTLLQSASFLARGRDD